MSNNDINITTLCAKVGISRNGYYKEHKQRKKQELMEEVILESVRKIRSKHPRMGGLKILHKIKYTLSLKEIRIGRDRLFKLLKKHNMLILKKRSCRTTNSNHSFKVYKNRIKDLPLTRPNQVWVSDITYIRTQEGFLYLSLITDAYSRKIVGYEVNDNLEAVGCLKAVNKAISQLPKGAEVIHHSDRGKQYCSNEYIKRLRKVNIKVSMTEENHCYENAKAERVNGILKGEYVLGDNFKNKSQARIACRQAILLYNSDRPHLSLGMNTPNMVHNNLFTNLEKCVNF